MYTLATLGSHHSRPGRNSPSKLRCLVSKIVFYQSLGSKKFLYAKSLKVVFYSEQQKRLLLPEVRREMPAFSAWLLLSLQAGLDRSRLANRLGLPRPPANQNVPSMARRPGAEASIKGFLSHVERNGIEVAKSWVFDWSRSEELDRRVGDEGHNVTII